MRGVGVGVKQRHGHRLRLCARDLRRQGARSGGLQRAQGTVGTHPLGRPEAQLARHQRLGGRRAKVIQASARLAAELDHIGEASGRDESRARGAALEQRVRGHGHAVREALHLPRARAATGQDQAHRLQHGGPLLAR